MKILLAADGSACTGKALAFLAAHPELVGGAGQVAVLHVQPTMPPRVTALAGAAVVHAHQREEARKVLAPVEEALRRQGVPFTAAWVVGSPAAEIVAAAREQQAHLIVMGTHGHGLLGRALMGSVAQKVLAGSDLPVLLVK